MSKRPTIATYEADDEGVEQLVHREMNDAEYKQYQVDVAAAKKAAEEEAARPHPLLEQVQTMSKSERAELKKLLEGA